MVVVVPVNSCEIAAPTVTVGVAATAAAANGSAAAETRSDITDGHNDTNATITQQRETE